MRIEATHRDGFTDHLLGWTLVAETEVGHVAARWFDTQLPRHTGSSSFQIPVDIQALIADMPSLEKLNEHYRCDVTDLCTLTLRVTEAEKTRIWELYGGEGLLDDHPELEPFFRFWRPISRAIESHLALPGRYVT